MENQESLSRAINGAICHLVTVARIFDGMDRDEDSKCALEIARDVSGLLPDCDSDVS